MLYEYNLNFKYYWFSVIKQAYHKYLLRNVEIAPSDSLINFLMTC
jgi:hypothetical protein